MEFPSSTDGASSVRAARILESRRSRCSPEEFKHSLRPLLRHVEDSVLRLRQLLTRKAAHCEQAEVVRLIASIREDERNIESMCVSACDRNDPDLSLRHDRLNNDHTLTLYERLSLATHFGFAERLIFLHKLQREICRRLKELGIETSQN